MVTTTAGPAFVRTIGDGPPVLVLHGGPGFAHDYLIAPLTPIAGRRRLIFFDQPGCGRSPAPEGGATLAATFAQCRALLALIGGDGLGVIAHSWGALVLTAAYADGGDGLPALGEGVLINPVAVRRAEWDAAFMTLIGRAPPSAVGEFMQLIGAGEGTAAMRVALPFYTRRGYTAAPAAFALNAATYAGLSASLGDFDYSRGADAFARLTMINGLDDFTSIELLQPLASRCAAVMRPPFGHFPFFEAPADFAAAMDGMFR